MSRAVHIVAVGARTPVGLTAESAAAAVRAGISRVRQHPRTVTLRGEPLMGAFDGLLEDAANAPARVRELGAWALAQVAEKLTRQRSLEDLAVPLWVALPEPRPGFGPQTAAYLGQSFVHPPRAPMRLALTTSLPAGHASAYAALEAAWRHIGSGRGELGIVLACDSYFDADALLWLEAEDRLMTAEARSAFAPGEGAACLALASDAARLRLGLPSLGVVRAVGTAQEPNAWSTGRDNLGHGLTEAILKATEALDPEVARVSDVYCDINGERHRVEEWGFAALRTQHAFEDVSRYITGVAEWGDMGAASGALALVLAVQAWQRGYARGRLALAWGSSDGGLCGAVLLEQPKGGA